MQAAKDHSQARDSHARYVWRFILRISSAYLTSTCRSRSNVAPSQSREAREQPLNIIQASSATPPSGSSDTTPLQALYNVSASVPPPPAPSIPGKATVGPKENISLSAAPANAKQTAFQDESTYLSALYLVCCPCLAMRKSLRTPNEPAGTCAASPQPLPMARLHHHHHQQPPVVEGPVVPPHFPRPPPSTWREDRIVPFTVSPTLSSSDLVVRESTYPDSKEAQTRPAPTRPVGMTVESSPSFSSIPSGFTRSYWSERGSVDPEVVDHLLREWTTLYD